MKKFFSISIIIAQVLIWSSAIVIICGTCETPIVFAAMASAAIITIILEQASNELKKVK